MNKKEEIFMNEFGNWVVNGTSFADYQKARDYLEAIIKNTAKDWAEFWNKYAE
jgi:hypothetical protein